MFRTVVVSGLLLSLVAGVALAEESTEGQENAQAEQARTLAKVRSQFDWSEWRRLPVLDDGRIKPLDTLANEVVVLVTGRSKWTDPKTDVTYRAPELLYLWVTARDEWLGKPVIRCEYRPLRDLLNTEQSPVPTEGTFVSVRDILDWEGSQELGKPVFWSEELESRLQELDRASKQNKNPETVGETAADRALNKKVAEFFQHMNAFLGASEARNIFVAPGLDPRVLTKQTNPDERLRAWVALGALLKLEEWESNADVTVAAVMAADHRDLLNELLSRRLYPPEHLPQLAQAQQVKGPLQVELRKIKPALEATREAYDKPDAIAFQSNMQTFVRQVRRLAGSLEEARLAMVPPEPNSLNFGMWNEDVWRLYKPLELNERQMEFSHYPDVGATDLEIVYNDHQPFARAWIYFLAATVIVAISFMVKIPRMVYFAGLAVGAFAIAYSTWGFGLRIAIAGRAPVTNMYETVVWVAYVVAVMGVWFALLPLIWPGLSWSWRLTGVPLRLKRNELGNVKGIEVDHLSSEERGNLFADFHIPIQIAWTAVRLAGFAWLVWFLTQSDTTFRIISLTPPAYKTLSFGSLGTWLVGIGTVLLSAWYVPRAVLALAGSVVTIIPSARRERMDVVWEKLLGRRFFVLPGLAVAFFGMLLAHYVGIRRPDILNPEVGSIAAVLRNNYWLTIHVLTIVSSYGAGALAWGLGNFAMLYYLLGKYRREGDPLRPSDSDAQIATFHPEGDPERDTLLSRLKRTGKTLLNPKSVGRTLKAGFQDFGSGDAHLETAQIRPPREVSTLASYGYKSMQVAVLLLAAGTILGGLWADVSWGRFWDWDPKEVWALISLLVYLAVLHGRFAGWVGTFGTNVGSVLCFTAIMMSWYGVNFILPQIHGWLNGTGQPTSVGLHSYATGAGGWEYVTGAVVLNWLLVLFAWARYALETKLIGPAVAANADDEEQSES